MSVLALALALAVTVGHKPVVTPPPPPLPAKISQLNWSGYTWAVRRPGIGHPGPSRWSNTADVVRVVKGELRLSITKNRAGQWISGQIANTRSLGYGTYHWVINSDLSKLSAHDVVGLFTYDVSAAPDYNEIDIEPSRWGANSGPNGTVTYYSGKPTEKTFTFSDKPPYQAEFTWRKRKLSFYVSDATGKPLIDVTYRDKIPTPRNEVAMMNYWRFRGENNRKSTVRIASFSWKPLK